MMHLSLVRFATIVLSLLATTVWIRVAIKMRERWAYTLPMLLWTLSLTIFTIFAELSHYGVISISEMTLDLWSAYLRMMSATLVIGIGVIYLHERWYINHRFK